MITWTVRPPGRRLSTRHLHQNRLYVGRGATEFAGRDGDPVRRNCGFRSGLSSRGSTKSRDAGLDEVDHFRFEIHGVEPIDLLHSGGTSDVDLCKIVADYVESDEI
jgi:hypothetical protein